MFELTDHCLVESIQICHLICSIDLSFRSVGGIYYSDNHNNSRANTCNKSRLLERMYLLDKRSTQALSVVLMHLITTFIAPLLCLPFKDIPVQLICSLLKLC